MDQSKSVTPRSRSTISDVCGHGGFKNNFVMLNMDLYNFV